MLKPVKTAASSKSPSETNAAKMSIVNDKQQRAAYEIQIQLEHLLRNSTKNKMKMLSYLIEMALIEVTSKVKRGFRG